MEVKVVVSLDERTASLLENLINALGVKVQNAITVPAPAEVKEVGAKKVVKPAEVSTVSEKKNTEIPKDISLEDIRTIARQLADAGRQAEYREILKDFGYEKVNQIKEADYLRVYTEMKSLVEGE